MPDCWETQVALKTLVDDTSTLAIERHLIQKLPDLLSPEVICDLMDMSRLGRFCPKVGLLSRETSQKAA